MRGSESRLRIPDYSTVGVKSSPLEFWTIFARTSFDRLCSFLDGRRFCPLPPQIFFRRFIGDVCRDRPCERVKSPVQCAFVRAVANHLTSDEPPINCSGLALSPHGVKLLSPTNYISTLEKNAGVFSLWESTCVEKCIDNSSSRPHATSWE